MIRPRFAAAISAAFLCSSILIPRAMGFFEAFSQLTKEIEAMEQSTPDSLDDLLKELEGVSGAGFGDVHEADWFYRYVSPVARWGIVSGYKDAGGKPTGVFGPANTVTVAEMLKMALKAAQVDETSCKGTTGLEQAENHWARSFVVCAREREMRILRPDPDLNRAATRAQVLSIIFDAFDDTVPPLFSAFKDSANHPLESDIAYAAALRMVSGDKDAGGTPTGTFRPDASVNRAEAAKIIYERLRVEVMGEG
ncbi:S-layer homology domain-containing protein [Candidatus Uhrbacteria bacterium]|nr:S-layer homology domain-containing protein [Candidatus Uhrbacteria bacterium]